MMVIAIPKVDKGGAQLVDVSKMSNPEQLLFQGAKETFDATISFRLSDECGGGFDTSEPDFGLKIIAHIDAAVVMTQSQPSGAAFRKSAEALSYRLADRL